MPAPFTHKKITEVEDSAPGLGWGTCRGAVRPGGTRRRGDRPHPLPPEAGAAAPPSGTAREAEEVYSCCEAAGG